MGWYSLENMSMKKDSSSPAEVQKSIHTIYKKLLNGICFNKSIQNNMWCETFNPRVIYLAETSVNMLYYLYIYSFKKVCFIVFTKLINFVFLWVFLMFFFNYSKTTKIVYAF